MLPGQKSSISLHFYFRIFFNKYLNPQHKKAEKTIKTPDPPLLLLPPPPLHHSACNCEWTDGERGRRSRRRRGAKGTRVSSHPAVTTVPVRKRACGARGWPENNVHWTTKRRMNATTTKRLVHPSIHPSSRLPWLTSLLVMN